MNGSRAAWIVGVVWMAGFGAATARSQGVRWSVPRAGAVEYSRIERARASAPCRGRALAQAAPLTAATPQRYVSRRSPAPVLCAGELRADGCALDAPVGDLRDLLRALKEVHPTGSQASRAEMRSAGQEMRGVGVAWAANRVPRVAPRGAAAQAHACGARRRRREEGSEVDDVHAG